MIATLNDILPKAQKGGYAVGLFNTIDTDMLEAVIGTAEALRSPVIIGTAEVLLPYGELRLIAPALLAAARAASVPVVLHFDHGLTFERCMEALKRGFSSLMFDGSAFPYAENVAQTREIVRVARAFGASVEGEIGHVGNAEDVEETPEAGFTTAEEAVRYLADTGVDALAVAIGTAHGAYKHKPRLSQERLIEIRRAVDAPLVLHGGSGLSDEDFRTCIGNGIAKVNIFTDLCEAGVRAAQASVAEKYDYLTARSAKRDAIAAAVARKIHLFGSSGKA